MDRCGVINAGPLIALSLAGRLDLLPRLFAEYWIPDVVWREVTGAGIWRPGAVTLADSVHQRHVREAPEPDPLLLAELDHGEAAVMRYPGNATPAATGGCGCRLRSGRDQAPMVRFSGWNPSRVDSFSPA